MIIISNIDTWGSGNRMMMSDIKAGRAGRLIFYSDIKRYHNACIEDFSAIFHFASDSYDNECAMLANKLIVSGIKLKVTRPKPKLESCDCFIPSLFIGELSRDLGYDIKINTPYINGVKTF